MNDGERSSPVAWTDRMAVVIWIWGYSLMWIIGICNMITMWLGK